MTLADLGEDAALSHILPGLPQTDTVLVGPGDDCAVLEVPSDPDNLSLLKTDTIVEKVHFLSSTDPEKVGWKAAARVVSDFAAMGGQPDHLVVSIALPANTTIDWLRGLYRGLTSCADCYTFSLCGGETTSVPEGSSKVITVSGTGRVRKNHLVTRFEGKPGDQLYVTGKLGGSFPSERHLTFSPRLAESTFLVSQFSPTAMMDLSDGLATDLPRLAKASHCGFQTNETSLPCHDGCTPQQAMSDGEDYELLFSIPAASSPELLHAWPANLAPLTQIGQLTHDSKSEIPSGFQHFQPPRD